MENPVGNERRTRYARESGMTQKQVARYEEWQKLKNVREALGESGNASKKEIHEAFLREKKAEEDFLAALGTTEERSHG